MMIQIECNPDIIDDSVEDLSCHGQVFRIDEKITGDDWVRGRTLTAAPTA
jgi:hypothetical protein